jgi:hypothetical protein
MRLKIQFGLINYDEMDWWRPLEDFPHIIKYLGSNYEWVLYDKDLTGRVDMILVYSEISRHDPRYGISCTLWNDLNRSESNDCQCGARFDRHFPNSHMMFCRKWIKW